MFEKVEIFCSDFIYINICLIFFKIIYLFKVDSVTVYMSYLFMVGCAWMSTG